MPKKLNLLNQTFGKLTVIDFSPNLSNGLTAWKCLCDCGNTCIVATKYLRSGDTKSCGCKIKEIDPSSWLKDYRQSLDKTGEKFNRLLILNKYKKDNEWWAHCKCDCGNEKDIRYHAVINGQIKSCGCLQKEHMIQLGRKAALDLTNQKYGLLTPLYRVDKADGTDTVWHCQCDCGKTIDVKTELLRNHHVSSCGCLSGSTYELLISQILDKENIKYIREKTFKTCFFKDTNQLAKFDFYIPEKNYIIEYDGIQHFKYKENTNFWNDKEHFIKTQEHDKIKNKWCKENNIILIRIPYTHTKITIEDLLPETSNFIFNFQEET